MNKQPPKKSGSGPEKPVADNPLALASTNDETPGAQAVTAAAPRLRREDVLDFTDAELDETLKVLRAEVRRRETDREASRPRTGSRVRILKGRPKYVGKIGTAVIVRRSRCFVAVPDITSPAYVMISDLELLER